MLFSFYFFSNNSWVLHHLTFWPSIISLSVTNVISRVLQNVWPHRNPHLSKGPSDIKQNGTKEKILFSGPVSHGLSCGVVLFVPTVSFWNHQIEASHWLKEEFWPIKKWFLELTLGIKQTTPSARAQKTIPENGAFSWVPFCLRSHVRFERCGNHQFNNKTPLSSNLNPRR